MQSNNLEHHHHHYHRHRHRHRHRHHHHHLFIYLFIYLNMIKILKPNACGVVLCTGYTFIFMGTCWLGLL